MTDYTPHTISTKEAVNGNGFYGLAYDNRDQGFILNTLQNLTASHDIDKGNFWALTQYALGTIRSLQNDLREAEGQLAVKDERIRLLEQLSTTDMLTGLLNRRGFMEGLEKELIKTNRDVMHGGILVMIDLDNFKTINDTYGHKAGDDALMLVAQTLNAHIRKMDYAARLGGDEFVLIFSNAHKVESTARLQKLARKLNSLSLRWDDTLIPVRASLGIHAYKKGDSMETVLASADSDMYEMKKDKQSRQN